MRLHGAQMKLDAYKVRYKESEDEFVYMKRKFEEASANLKKQLAECGIENLTLKKQIAVLKGQR